MPGHIDDLSQSTTAIGQQVAMMLPTSGASLRRESSSWRLVWCDELSHKDDNKAMREAVDNIAQEFRGTLVCRRKASKFESWYARPQGPHFVLLSSWREAKPCLELIMKPPIQRSPMSVVVFADTQKVFVRASAWVKTQGAPCPIRVIRDLDELGPLLAEVVQKLQLDIPLPQDPGRPFRQAYDTPGASSSDTTLPWSPFGYSPGGSGSDQTPPQGHFAFGAPARAAAGTTGRPESSSAVQADSGPQQVEFAPMLGQETVRQPVLVANSTPHFQAVPNVQMPSRCYLVTGAPQAPMTGQHAGGVGFVMPQPTYLAQRHAAWMVSSASCGMPQPHIVGQPADRAAFVMPQQPCASQPTAVWSRCATVPSHATGQFAGETVDITPASQVRVQLGNWLSGAVPGQDPRQMVAILEDALPEKYDD
mmetsp:Transcript_35222/g.101271  ORF Transcript_35222/g.101271 Transcript_35222/m.101271 type:complete len:421 (+) Transcript_35222:77-1339(+)